MHAFISLQAQYKSHEEIGQINTDHYWSASALTAIYCYRLLPKGTVASLVTKAQILTNWTQFQGTQFQTYAI
jgi:hypothetical protein